MCSWAFVIPTSKPTEVDVGLFNDSCVDLEGKGRVLSLRHELAAVVKGVRPLCR